MLPLSSIQSNCASSFCSFLVKVLKLYRHNALLRRCNTDTSHSMIFYNDPLLKCIRVLQVHIKSYLKHFGNINTNVKMFKIHYKVETLNLTFKEYFYRLFCKIKSKCKVR